MPLTDSLVRCFQDPTPVPNPLRIGVLVDSDTLPAVFRAILEDIAASGFARLCAVILNDESVGGEVAPRPLVSRLLRTVTDPHRRRHALFSAYESLIEPRLRPTDSPLEALDCTDLLHGPGVTRIPVVPIRSRYVHRFPVEALDAVRAENLDVILRFGFHVLRGDILDVPRYGVWSYHHGDNAEYRGLPPGFWEIVEGNPVSGAILQRLTEELDAGLTLAKAQFTTHSTVSMARNQFGPYWGSRHFVLQTLARLHREGWESVVAHAPPAEAYRGKRALYRRPTNADVAGWVTRRVLPAIGRKLRALGTEQTWRVGLRYSATPFYADSEASALADFRWVPCPKGHFWADPFLAEGPEGLLLFFEDYDYSTEKGVIGCAPVAASGEVGPAATVLEVPTHLSYPLVFPHGGEWFLVPENAAGGGVDLYRARRFPFDWVRETRLLDIPGLDSTPFETGGQWWMLTTPALPESHAAITLLYSAPALTGPWTLHPAQAVASDVRYARSGGHVIRENPGRATERLVRVAQNCAGDYGREVVFREIGLLTSRDYRDAPLAVRPATGMPAMTGLHTYNRVGHWDAIDGKFARPSRRIR